jgi:AraC-like DNA-binding protein
VCNVLLDRRQTCAPALDARYDLVDLRTPHLRVMRMTSTRVATDYSMLNRAMPYTQHKERPSLLVVLDGEARFDENNTHRLLSMGEFVQSDGRLGGTEAHAGRVSSCLAFEWDPAMHGVEFVGPFVTGRLDVRDVSRLARAAHDLDGVDPTHATAEIIEILVAAGLGFRRVSARELHTSEKLQPLQNVISNQLASLDARPSITDLATSVGWNERRVHRSVEALAKSYQFSWRHWREALRQARLLQALRWLSVPRATTELVSTLTGFGSPIALCHAFSRAGLPSPQQLARAASNDVLGRWAEVIDGLG